MTAVNFELDPRLQADCFEIAEFALSKVLLLDNAALPWLILVPKEAGLTELTDLPLAKQQELLKEINQLSQVIQDLFQPDKLNIAAIGNVVSQLHIHVIGRYKNDPVWPSPVWGNLPDAPYDQDRLKTTIAKLQQAINSD